MDCERKHRVYAETDFMKDRGNTALRSQAEEMTAVIDESYKHKFKLPQHLGKC